VGVNGGEVGREEGREGEKGERGRREEGRLAASTSARPCAGARRPMHTTPAREQQRRRPSGPGTAHPASGHAVPQRTNVSICVFLCVCVCTFPAAAAMVVAGSGVAAAGTGNRVSFQGPFGSSGTVDGWYCYFSEQ
jgi:nitrate reductase NapE component